MPVYFIQSSTGHIKIGRVDEPDDVNKRLRTLQTANPEPLKVLAIYSGTPRYENRIHRHFAHLRGNGEWFKPSQELLDFIANLDESILDQTGNVSDFAKWLNSQLHKQNMKPANLARASKLAPSTISRLLNGQIAPTSEAVSKIAKSLTISVDEAFRRAGFLPANEDDNPTIAAVVEIMAQLSPADQREVLNYAHYRLTSHSNERS